jgi:hypothetical protein
MLISEKLNTIVRILLTNVDKDMRPGTIAKKAGITSAMAQRIVLKLERTGYVTIRGTVKVINRMKLIRAWGYCTSIRELERVEYIAVERPQYVMMKIANSAQAAGLKYAFTLFSATEHISPYVAPSDTYVYVKKRDIKAWDAVLRSQNMLPQERDGNVILLPVDDEYFEGAFEVRGVHIVSLPQLYVDLFSFGGRGEEAAEQILNATREKEKNV